MKILFLGNSFTYFNDMPGMLSELSGGTIECESVTRGGAFLSEYADENSEVRRHLDALLLAGNRYDFTVLQEQSLLPAKEPATMLESVRRVVVLIPDTRFVLYQTWSYARGSEKLADTGFSFEEMTGHLAHAYRGAADALGLALVPVGDAFAEAERRGLALYLDDSSHPNAAGSYLAACLFYRAFTGRNVAGFDTLPGVSAADAHELRRIANLTDVRPLV